MLEWKIKVLIMSRVVADVILEIDPVEHGTHPAAPMISSSDIKMIRPIRFG